MATDKTIPKKPEKPRRRCGPKPKSANGVPMTAAQRKALQRERDRIKLAQKRISEMTLEALVTAIGEAVKEKRPQDLSPLFAELRSRSKTKSDAQ